MCSLNNKETINKIEDCKKGNHDLKEMYRAENLYGEEIVVRWCETCGAIVIDGERDNKLYAGKYMKLVASKLAKQIEKIS